MARTSRILSLGLTTALAAAGAVMSLSAGPARREAHTEVDAQTTAGYAADPAILKLYQWRSIGPDRGGRSIAASGVKGRPREAYFGATGGGLWKTTDAGENWAPVTDGQITSASVGAVAVSETNPDLVFIGTGESCIRGNIMPGDGIYKSTDAGKTWTHAGFRNAQNISRVRIHPTEPNTVFVAAFGPYGVPHEERGIFKSTDGGATWRKVLYRGPQSAGVDLSIDRSNPRVIYAAMWEAFRKEYTMSSGGPTSGLFKSTDGGETWQEITRASGLPKDGPVGRIGVSVSGADSNRVYALIEHADGGLFASDDGGATWALSTANRNIRQRAFYYTHVAADPKARDTVYLLNVSAYRSTDGGKTIPGLGGGTHSDFHDIWIDPDDPQHLVIANDGGGAVSTNGGAAWTAQDFPTAQYYQVVTTKHLPYHVCGAQQDGSTVCLSNESVPGAAAGGGRGGGGGAGGGGGGRGGAQAPAMYSPGGAEPGYIAPDPKDVDQFFAGSNNGGFLIWTNRRTGQSREVHPYPRMFSGEPASALVERVQWTFPIIFSPVDPTALYTATQHVWKTTNGGQTWARISDDLTRHDPKTLGHSGGPITGDMNGPEVYATVFALGPSKVDANVLWAGSDDGMIHVTRNGGKSWENVTPKDMPEFGRVSIIDASAFDAGTAYAAVKRPLLGDEAPYVFRTHDFGKSWTKIVNGLKPNDYAHTVREDHKRRGLLYTGTQHGVYYSYNDGDNWHSLSLNLPDIPIKDLIVEDRDLAIATHGRSFYILDDIGPLRQSTPEVSSAAGAYLFVPDDAIRSYGGATLRYWVKGPVTDLKIEVVDKAGTVVREFTSAPTPPAVSGRAGGAAAAGGQGRGGGGRGGGFPAGMATAPGFNSVTWDLRYPSATSFPGMILWGGGVQGPLAAPGAYTVRMTADGRVQTQPVRVRRNPLFAGITDADLQAQFDLAIQIRDKTSEANNAVINVRRIKEQVLERVKTNGDTRLKAAGDKLSASLSAVEEEIYQVRMQSGQDPLNFPIKINNRLASLLSVVNRGDGRPIGNAPAIFKDLAGELKVQTDRLARVYTTDLAAFNAEAKRLGLDTITEK